MESTTFPCPKHGEFFATELIRNEIAVFDAISDYFSDLLSTAPISSQDHLLILRLTGAAVRVRMVALWCISSAQTVIRLSTSCVCIDLSGRTLRVVKESLVPFAVVYTRALPLADHPESFSAAQEGSGSTSFTDGNVSLERLDR